MPLRITAFYAAVLAALFLLLSVRVIQARHRHQVALGAPHRAIERAVRAHGNFAEYAPLALLLLALAETFGLAPVVLHGLGLALVAGRASHAWGISQEPEVLRFRAVGMALTFGVIGVTAAVLLGLALFA